MGVTPRAIVGPAGPLFAIHVTPEDARKRRDEAVLYVPPFAEEMNRSRRMATLLARSLADEGFEALILDLYGTGDSAGDFEDAGWSAWCQDVEAACLWFAEQGYRKVSMVGLRLGACLALQAAAAASLQDLVAHVILWQPVVSGENFLNQFLRIRIAAGLGGANGAKPEPVKELRTQLSEGATLEVAGYQLTSDMAAAIEVLDLGELALRSGRPLTWFELGPGTDPSPASRQIIDRLSAGGVEVEARVLKGEPFWSIEETALVPVLWQETAAALIGR